MGIFMKETIVQLIAAGMGTLGYGVLFRLRTKHMVTAVIGGVMTWGIYLIFANVIEGVFYPTLIASAAAVAYAEIMARLLKAPVPLYVLPSVISLVPGGSLYYTMSYCMERDWEQFGIYGYRTVQYALAIAAGMSLVWALADMWKRGIEKGKQKRWEERI